MKNLTDKQHLQWSVGGQPFAPRTEDVQTFDFKLGKCDGPVGSWAQELQRAMCRLVDEHGSDLALFYSGGSDSEVILRMLLRIGVRPKVYTIKFSLGENHHETTHADEFCRSVGITPTVFTHNMQLFMVQDMCDLGIRYQCSQMAYLTVLQYVKKLDIPVIMGGEVYLQKHQKISDTVHSPEEWYYIYREDEDGMTYRYSKDTGHTLINEVLTYTPGLLLSWLHHPTIGAVATNQVPGKITLLSVKTKVYEQELGVQLAAKTKFHGYETMTWTNRKNVLDLKSLIGVQQQVARLEYNQLIEDLQ